ncbi:MAG: hypothetical protein ABI790_05380 [Betaproteobacteria bacterium]
MERIAIDVNVLVRFADDGDVRAMKQSLAHQHHLLHEVLLAVAQQTDPAVISQLAARLKASGDALATATAAAAAPATPAPSATPAA